MKIPSVMDISPILKEIYPSTKKKKSKSKRFGRIERILDAKNWKGKK
jgi:hypothetical protein